METLAQGSQYLWDGTKRFKKGDQPFVFFQFTLAGWGIFESPHIGPTRTTPGTAFAAVVPSRHRYYLPPESPGWSFAWLNIHHPYLVERVARQIALAGSVLRVKPSSPAMVSALAIVTGNLKKNFRDRFEVELALFRFIIDYERLLARTIPSANARDLLTQRVTELVLRDPTQTRSVSVLAAEFGMSRSHFSHYFRENTGQTPARAVMQTRVEAAARMLLSSELSLKQIAAACGFPNADHFNRVFRRLRNVSPGVYRKQAR